MDQSAGGGGEHVRAARGPSKTDSFRSWTDRVKTEDIDEERIEKKHEEEKTRYSNFEEIWPPDHETTNNYAESKKRKKELNMGHRANHKKSRWNSRHSCDVVTARGQVEEKRERH